MLVGYTRLYIKKVVEFFSQQGIILIVKLRRIRVVVNYLL